MNEYQWVIIFVLILSKSYLIMQVDYTWLKNAQYYHTDVQR